LDAICDKLILINFFKPGGEVKVKCPKCNYQNKEGLSYCARCGNFIGNTCPNCNEAVEPGNVYCGSCGWKLNPHGKSQDLTEEFATFLRGTKQTLQYWGWAFLGILLVIGILLGVGQWGKVMDMAIEKAENMVEEKVDIMITGHVKKNVDKGMSDVAKDKAYVNLRFARFLNSIHRKFVTGEEYAKQDYLQDIRYWIGKAEKQYADLVEKYPTNPEFNFELGRIYYNFPLLYGAEDLLSYGDAIKFFEKALDYYSKKQREKGWDKEAYYYLGNIYYDLWREHKRKEDEGKSIENFGNALEGPVKLNKKFLYCAENMLYELKGQGKCECTAEQRFSGYIPE